MEEESVNASSDKTFYREEEEEVTFITYQSPVRQEGSGELKHRGNVEPEEDEESDKDEAAPIQSTDGEASHSAGQSSASGGGMWRLVRLLLLLAMSAAVLYYIYGQVV